MAGNCNSIIQGLAALSILAASPSFANGPTSEELMAAEMGLINSSYRTTPDGSWAFDGTNAFIPFDATTGQELWKFHTGSDVIGPLVTRTQDGEHYIAVMSGWGGAVALWGGEVTKIVKSVSQGGSLWAFKLPQS